MISWKSDSLGSVFSFFKNVFIWSISNKSVQFSSVAQSRPTICGPMNCSTPGFSVHHQLLELTQIHVHWVSDAIQPSHPLIIPVSAHPKSFPASESFPVSQFFLSGGQSIHFNISPSKEYSGLISFRIDWLDLLAVQGTLKNFLQHHSSKASILWHSAFLSPTLTSVHDHWKNYSLN